jgi:hypothetical protein
VGEPALVGWGSGKYGNQDGLGTTATGKVQTTFTLTANTSFASLGRHALRWLTGHKEAPRDGAMGVAVHWRRFYGEPAKPSFSDEAERPTFAKSHGKSGLGRC